MNRTEVTELFLAGTLLFTGCTGNKEGINIKYSTSVIPKTQFYRAGEFQDAIDLGNKFYPEMSQYKDFLTGLHKIQTKSGISTVVLNYTTKRFDVAAAEWIYQTIEDLAVEQYSNKPVQYQLNNQDRFLLYTLNPLVSRRFMAIVSDDTQGLQAGQTTLSQNGETAVSLLITNSNDKDGFDALSSFTVEACQQTVTPLVYVKKKEQEEVFEPIKDADEVLTGQEVGCSSLGYAIAMRILGDSYYTYNRVINSATFRNLKLVPEILPVLDEERFNTIPVSTHIFY